MENNKYMIGKDSQDSHGMGRLTNSLKMEKEERDLYFWRSQIITPLFMFCD